MKQYIRFKNNNKINKTIKNGNKTTARIRAKP